MEGDHIISEECTILLFFGLKVQYLLLLISKVLHLI